MSKGYFLGIFSGGAFGSVGRFLGLFKSLCSFLFDGVNDSFNISGALPVLATTTKGTWLISLKVVDATPTGNESIIMFGDTSAQSDIMLYINLTTGKLTIISRKASVEQFALTTDAQAFTDNTWHTLAVVQDAVDVKMYIDSVFIAQTFSTTLLTSSWFNNIPLLDNGNLGSRKWNGLSNDLFLNGYINQCSLLDTNLNVSELSMWHNGGEPKSSKALFPTNTVYDWIPQDALTFDTVNNEWAVLNGVKIPYINKAVFFDGINNEMTAPTTNLAPSIFGGSGNIYTIYATIIAPPATGIRTIFTGNPTSFWFMISGGRVRLISNSLTTDVEALTVLKEGKEYNISVSLDFGNITNNKIVVNGVSETLSTNTATLTNTLPTSYGVGKRASGGSYYTGNIKSLSVVNRMTTLAEDILMHNDGKGANPHTIFGTDCKLFTNADDSVWTGSEFEITDAVSSNVFTSVNMVEADLKYRGNNISHSENMVLASKDCTENPY